MVIMADTRVPESTTTFPKTRPKNDLSARDAKRDRARRKLLQWPWIMLLGLCVFLPVEAWAPLLLFATFLSFAFLDEAPD